MATPHKSPSYEQKRLKTWPWWHDDYGKMLSPQGRDILEKSGVLPGEMWPHIHAVRDRAWEIYPFPCIGEFLFLQFGLSKHPKFSRAVSYLKDLDKGQSGSNAVKTVMGDSGTGVVDNILHNAHLPRLLDIGTCVGQDVRLFLHEGVPKECLYGTDVFPGFEDVGHDFFRDKETFSGRFFRADVFDDSSESPLNSTRGMWDIVSASMFTHQFDLDRQRVIARRMVRLLRPSKGSTIIGTSNGQLEAMDIPLRAPFCEKPGDKVVYRQNKETMHDLWSHALTDCGEDTKNWQIFCEYDEAQIARREREQRTKGEVRFFQGKGQRRIFFSVEKLT